MSSESTTREQRLQQVLAEFLHDVEAGKNPDREKLLAQHPDLADELRSFLVEHEKMRRLVELAGNAEIIVAIDGPAHVTELVRALLLDDEETSDLPLHVCRDQH